MGLASAPDIFQARMRYFFQDMESIIVYMDDLLIIGVESYEKYIEQVDELLTRLKSKQMQVNPDKSFWAKTEITYLGFLMNQQGIKPQLENVKAMLDSKPPKNKKYLRQFIGMVNYYKDLFKKSTDILKPLTDICGKSSTFAWDEKVSKAFIEVKAMIIKVAMFAFPDFTKPVDLHTDSSDYQPGSSAPLNSTTSSPTRDCLGLQNHSSNSATSSSKTKSRSILTTRTLLTTVQTSTLTTDSVRDS